MSLTEAYTALPDRLAAERQELYQREGIGSGVVSERHPPVERPILFSAAMVRAILDGSKTQTRRSVRIDDTPILKSGRMLRGIPAGAENVRFIGCYLKCDSPAGSVTVSSRVPCPYGGIGDRLWVKETFRNQAVSIASGAGYNGVCVIHRASAHKDDAGPWKPSIFMPRWASRLTLEITGVRVERLQDISEKDARAEGVRKHWYPATGDHPDMYGWVTDADGEFGAAHLTAPGAYQKLWESINGPGSWALNPYVWVVEFRKLATP